MLVFSYIEEMYWFPYQAKWELYQMGAPPYKIIGSFIRWEPYHIKQMGTLLRREPYRRKGILRAASCDVARYLLLRSMIT